MTFYRAILTAIGRPERLIVVDDGNAPLMAARRLGALTIKVGPTGDGAHDLVVDTIADLPTAIGSLV